VCRDFGCLIHKVLKIFVIGEVIISLSSGYYALGRHQDALAILEKALDFMPENNPSIGAV
jgi:tetratricopeptide (TPR) repeat protein